MSRARYVTDTHPLVWYAGGQTRKLGRRARTAFVRCEAGEAEIHVPAPVVIETWFLVRNGTIEVETSFSAWWRELERAGLICEELELDDVLTASELEWDHRDPFDRLIVATAQRFELPLITADAAIEEAALVPTVW